METKKNITNEDLGKKFKNQFELVNYAIKLAENMIRTGRGPRIETESQNKTIQVLGEITTGKDYFDEIVITETFSREEHSEERNSRRDEKNEGRDFFGKKKGSDSIKKSRKVLTN